MKFVFKNDRTGRYLKGESPDRHENVSPDWTDDIGNAMVFSTIGTGDTNTLLFAPTLPYSARWDTHLLTAVPVTVSRIQEAR